MNEPYENQATDAWEREWVDGNGHRWRAERLRLGLWNLYSCEAEEPEYVGRITTKGTTPRNLVDAARRQGVLS